MVQTGIYARISVAHGNHKDDTIEHQILLARDWIQDQCSREEQLEEYCCYVDRGYSGTHFDRPGFGQMIEDARAGKIQCILCKDASRLGRNHLEVGEYMERIFPSLGIRLVCISEGYDSNSQMPGSLGVNIRNLLYQWYAKDIGRKVHLVKEEKKRQGEYLGSRPPYGFSICYCQGKRVLKKNEEAQKLIEQMAIRHRQGESYQTISNWLWQQGVCPPGEYLATGKLYGKPGEVKSWDISSVRYVILSYTRGDYHTA